LWIFALAPWIERLERAVKLKGGLAALTAAVVGVIANLSAWLVLHVLFVQVDEVSAGPLHLYTPDWNSFDWRAALLAVFLCWLVFGAGWSVIRVVAVAALGGLVVRNLL
jgi:chromate transporter